MPVAAEGVELEARVWTAAAAVAIGMSLLIPTFNALNNSYVEDVAPPPWMPTPEKPPNITPPTDFQPPPDFEPPEGWEGEVPPDQCPPPVLRRIPEVDDVDEPLTGGSSTFSGYGRDVSFTVPEATVGVRIYVNYTDWRAQRVYAAVDEPEGGQDWSAQMEGGATPLLGPATEEDITTFVYDTYTQNNGKPATPGETILSLRADFPLAGNVRAEGYMVLACGGLLS